MEIKSLAQQIEKVINEKMAEFAIHGKKSGEIGRKVAKMESERLALHQKMADIVMELEPVEAIVRAQNPNMNDLFDKLKAAYATNAFKEVVHEEVNPELV